ncbi:MAG TPA: ABC transporter permease [Gemmatimonadales bacterium]
MSLLTSFARRVRALLFQSRAEREMEREIRFHLDRETEKNTTLGMSEPDARRKARLDFGGLETVREEHREARGLPLLEEIWADVRYALRGLRRNPTFAIACVLTLAVGIGVNSAVFSVADGVLFRTLPYPHPEQLVSAWAPSAPAAEYVAVRDRVAAFQGVSAYDEVGVNVGDAGNAARAQAAVVTADMFETLGVAPTLGRALAPGTDRPGGPPEIVLSDGLWRNRFSGRADVLGKGILVDGAVRRVVGVMPPWFHFPSMGTDLWIPASINAAEGGNYWGWWRYRIVARLRPGLTAVDARTQMRGMAVGLRREHPFWDPGPTYGQGADAVPLQRQLSKPARTTLTLLMGVTGALLLVACANVVNLVLGRAARREPEFQVRAVLGSGRARLARLLVAETMLLALAGGIAAAGLAWLALALFRGTIPAMLTRLAPIEMDGRVLAFTGVLALGAGLAAGVWPALKTRNRVATMRVASRGRGHRRLASVLVVAQLALAVTLVSCAGLLIRSFAALTLVEPGFAPDGVLAARVTLAPAAYPDQGRQAEFFDRVVATVAALPGVRAAAAVSAPPLRGRRDGLAIRVEGQFEDVRHVLPTVDHRVAVTPSYFATMGIAVLQGRAFTTADRAGAPWVAMVSRSTARHFWPGRSPIGQRVGLPYESPWITVVGEVADVRQDSLSGQNEMSIYAPLGQTHSGLIADMTVLVRAADPAAQAAPLTAAVQALDPTVPVSEIRTMAQIIDASLDGPRFAMSLLGICAALALLLGAVGVYGVLSAVVTDRTREIGIRVALGATPATIGRLVLTRGAVLAAIGVGVGLCGAYAATSLVRGLLFNVTPHDPVTFIGVPFVLGLVALTASWLPARRAVRGNPVDALRSE